MYQTPQSDFDTAAATIAGVSARVVQSLDALAPADAGDHRDFLESLGPPLHQHLRASALFSTFENWAVSEERRLGDLLQLLLRLLLEVEPAGSSPAHSLFRDFVVSQAAVSLTESALYRTAEEVEALLVVFEQSGDLPRPRAARLMIQCPDLLGQPVRGDHLQDRLTPERLMNRLEQLDRALEGMPYISTGNLVPGFQDILEVAPQLLLQDYPLPGHPVETLGLLMMKQREELVAVVCAAPQLAQVAPEAMQGAWKALNDGLGPSNRMVLLHAQPEVLALDPAGIQERLAVWKAVVGRGTDVDELLWVPSFLQQSLHESAARLFCLCAHGPREGIHLSATVAPDDEFMSRYGVTAAELERWRQVSTLQEAAGKHAPEADSPTLNSEGDTSPIASLKEATGSQTLGPKLTSVNSEGDVSPIASQHG